MWPVPFGGGWQCGNAVLDATCVTRHDHQELYYINQIPEKSGVELSKSGFQPVSAKNQVLVNENRVFDQAASPKASKTNKNSSNP